MAITMSRPKRYDNYFGPDRVTSKPLMLASYLKTACLGWIDHCANAPTARIYEYFQ